MIVNHAILATIICITNCFGELSNRQAVQLNNGNMGLKII